MQRTHHLPNTLYFLLCKDALQIENTVCALFQTCKVHNTIYTRFFLFFESDFRFGVSLNSLIFSLILDGGRCM